MCLQVISKILVIDRNQYNRRDRWWNGKYLAGNGCWRIYILSIRLRHMHAHCSATRLLLTLELVKATLPVYGTVCIRINVLALLTPDDSVILSESAHSGS